MQKEKANFEYKIIIVKKINEIIKKTKIKGIKSLSDIFLLKNISEFMK